MADYQAGTRVCVEVGQAAVLRPTGRPLPSSEPWQPGVVVASLDDGRWRVRLDPLRVAGAADATLELVELAAPAVALRPRAPGTPCPSATEARAPAG